MENKPISSDTVKVGHVYAAKRPVRCGSLFREVYNDRHVLWINESRTLVQYDSPAVRIGSRHPAVKMDKFIKWAGRDVTAETQPGEWRTFENKQSKPKA